VTFSRVADEVLFLLLIALLWFREWSEIVIAGVEAVIIEFTGRCTSDAESRP